MASSEDSDIDSTVTPVERGENFCAMLEFDSLNDFYLPLSDVPARHKTRTKSRYRRPNLSDSEDLPDLRKEDIKEIYKELQTISSKLKEENRILQEREQNVRERERMVSISQGNIQTITEHQTKQKLSAVEQKYKCEIEQLEQALREKTKENKRLKDSFETLKLANDALKKDFELLQSQHEKLEKQAVSVQSRLKNLQRKQDFVQRQKDGSSAVVTSSALPAKQSKSQNSEMKTKSAKQHKCTTPASSLDVLAVLLDWICDMHLRQAAVNPGSKSQLTMESELIQEKVFKMLPPMAELVKEFPGQNIKLALPCLQFLYWALTHTDHTQSQQKSNLSSTLRRLGEELYRTKSLHLSNGDQNMCEREGLLTSPIKLERSKDSVYFRSSNLHVRLLSSLVILKTLSQVDFLAHVFDVLRNDLKSDTAKELFLYYRATPVVLHFLKPVNKPFVSSAMDVFLQMSMESPFLTPFLESCSNESWFRTIAMVLRSPSQDSKIIEKLSIVLQKLSKLRSNRRFFEVYTITGIIQEILHGCGTDQAFLALNLKSVLFNLSSTSKSQYPND